MSRFAHGRKMQRALGCLWAPPTHRVSGLSDMNKIDRAAMAIWAVYGGSRKSATKAARDALHVSGAARFTQEMDAARMEIQILRSMLGSTVPALQQHHRMVSGGRVKSERLALLKSVVNATDDAGE